MNFASAVNIVCVFVFATVIHISRCQEGRNCLKTNPRVLHSVFDWYDKDFDPWVITESDVTSMINLFSTRFDRAYVMNGILSSVWLPVALGVAKFRTEKKSGVQLYIKTHPGDADNGRNESIKILKGYYDMVRTVHKVNNGTIGGLILETNLKTYTEDLEVYEEVFGSLDTFAEFDLGVLIEPNKLPKSTTIEFFKRVKFLIVDLDVKVAERPEISADELISSCDYLQANARLNGISGEVLCYTGYPVTGTDVNGLEGSLDGFQRFWCRIVTRLNSEKGHARIIMQSAFDESLTAISSSTNGFAKVKYGWWRRKNLLSSNESDFEEKVESLENVTDLKLKHDFERNYSDSSYFVAILVIVVVQFGLIVYILVILSRLCAHFKKLSRNTKMKSEDNHIFEMETSSN